MMKYALDSFNLQCLLTDFSVVVEENGYKRLPYSYWKDLKKFNCKSVQSSWDAMVFIGNDDNCITLTGKDCDDFIFFADAWLQTHASEIKETIAISGTCSNYITTSNNYTDSYDLYTTSTQTNKSYTYLDHGLTYKDCVRSIIDTTTTSDSLVDTVEEIVKNYIEKDNNITQERKEKDTMNMFSKMNFDFGPANPEAIKLSPFGMAIKTPNRSWHTYDAANQKIVDVSDFNFSFGSMPIFYKMPVAPDAVAVGDVILHNARPVFVIGFTDEQNKAAGIICIDTDSNEQKTVLPVCNVFNFNFITKIVSLFNMAGNGAGNVFGTPTADQPFGNIFGMMMMSEMFKDNGKTGDNDFFKMMMMSQVFGGGVNPFAQMFNGFVNAVPGVPAGPQDA